MSVALWQLMGGQDPQTLIRKALARMKEEGIVRIAADYSGGNDEGGINAASGFKADGTEIIRQCLDIGHDAVVGALDGGVTAWRGSGRTITGIRLVAPDEMVGTVIDVRLSNEYVAGHVPEAINIELGSLAAAVLPDGPITVMCGHGERAMTGASLIAGRGHRDVNVLDGGPDEWSARHGLALTVG